MFAVLWIQPTIWPVEFRLRTFPLTTGYLWDDSTEWLRSLKSVTAVSHSELLASSIALTSYWVGFAVFSNFTVFSLAMVLLRLPHVLRWADRARHIHAPPIVGPLDVDEVERVRVFLLRKVQSDSHKGEIKDKKASRSLGKSSNLLTLTPFLDQCSLICLGGRLARLC